MLKEALLISVLLQLIMILKVEKYSKSFFKNRTVFVIKVVEFELFSK